MNEELLQILCCPETKQSLTLADRELIRTINRRIADKKLCNRGGRQLYEKIDGGFIREDGKYLYPIRQNIPIMLIDEALSL